MLLHPSEVLAAGQALALNNSTKVFAVVSVGVAEVMDVFMETECEAEGTWNEYQTSLLFEQLPVTTTFVALYKVPGNVEQAGPTVTGTALAQRSFGGTWAFEAILNNSSCIARMIGFFIGWIMDLQIS